MNPMIGKNTISTPTRDVIPGKCGPTIRCWMKRYLTSTFRRDRRLLSFAWVDWKRLLVVLKSLEPL
jgi:hypothetical protein